MIVGTQKRHRRLDVTGLACDRTARIALPQVVLADVLGLSAVHVNRMLQSLRRRELMSWKGAEVTTQDFPCLVELANSDETYLSLVKLPR